MPVRRERYEMTYRGPCHVYVVDGQEFMRDVPVEVTRAVKERIMADQGPARQGARWDVRRLGPVPEPVPEEVPVVLQSETEEVLPDGAAPETGGN